MHLRFDEVEPRQAREYLNKTSWYVVWQDRFDPTPYDRKMDAPKIEGADVLKGEDVVTLIAEVYAEMEDGTPASDPEETEEETKEETEEETNEVSLEGFLMEMNGKPCLKFDLSEFEDRYSEHSTLTYIMAATIYSHREAIAALASGNAVDNYTYEFGSYGMVLVLNSHGIKLHVKSDQAQAYSINMDVIEAFVERFAPKEPQAQLVSMATMIDQACQFSQLDWESFQATVEQKRKTIRG